MRTQAKTNRLISAAIVARLADTQIYGFKLGHTHNELFDHINGLAGFDYPHDVSKIEVLDVLDILADDGIVLPKPHTDYETTTNAPVRYILNLRLHR